jgi:hypothetical protein
VTTYRSREYPSFWQVLTDAAIGFVIGVPLAVVAWLGTVWLVMR